MWISEDNQQDQCLAQVSSRIVNHVPHETDP